MAQNLDFTLKRHNGIDVDILYPTTIWSQVLDKPSTFTPTYHTHVLADITDLSAGTLSEATTGTITAQRSWSPSILKQAIESLSDLNTNNYLTGLSFNTSDGILTATRSGLSNLTVDLDGRYSLSSHTHTISNIDSLQSVLDAKEDSLGIGTNGQFLRWGLLGAPYWDTVTPGDIGAQVAGTYNTIIGTDTDINTSGSTIIDNINVTDGVITSMGTRVLTLADLGFTGDTNANYFTYTHPTYAGDDFSVDSGALTGSAVVSDIDINVTTDTLGHVTDANGVVSTRNLDAIRGQNGTDIKFWTGTAAAYVGLGSWDSNTIYYIVG